ncbi:DUF2806 domain-containing protein [Nitratidesulfovibrio sp. D1]|uniref:DUF2806 domain-containing protein n=1 Tax=Nitratidesulfovibrio sp. D1 TaxID=3440151 RepID=UPI003EB8BCD0
MPDDLQHLAEISGHCEKPALELISTISKATGTFFKPWIITRNAKAEAKAAEAQARAKALTDEILTESQIKTTELKLRALTRFTTEEIRKQINIDTILDIALPLLSNGAKSREIDSDWVHNFINKSSQFSDADMQNLWGRILAGEANAPGSYSRRTINILNDFSKDDLKGFESICRFSLRVEEEDLPVIINHSDDIYARNGIDYIMLHHLDDIGLISYTTPIGTNYTFDTPPITFSYFGHRITLNISPDTEIPIGQVVLTKSGTELHKLANQTAVPGFLEHLCDYWQKKGLNPTITT